MGEVKRRQKTDAKVLNDFQAELEILLMMHFPEGVSEDSEDDDLQCEKCVDFKLDLCEGQGLKGESVIKVCFSKKMGRKIVVAR